MRSQTILYQDAVDSILAVALPTSTPNEDACSICGQEYGSVEQRWQHNLHFLDELPGAFRRTYVQQIVEAVRTPCNHAFCTFCLSTWLLKSVSCTCPLCRTPIQVPNLASDENTDDGQPNVGIQGLSISLNVSTPAAEEVFNILKMQKRHLLTTETEIPYTLHTRAMMYDLPRVMINVARRFHYQSLGETVPKDAPYMKLHNPADRMVSEESYRHLRALFRPDAPLAQHADAINMYDFLVRIMALMGRMDGLALEGPTMSTLYDLVSKKMPEVDGGVGRRRWCAYVWCVVKALVVWQAYCERAQRLMSRRVEDAVGTDGRRQLSQDLWSGMVDTIA